MRDTLVNMLSSSCLHPSYILSHSGSLCSRTVLFTVLRFSQRWWNMLFLSFILSHRSGMDYPWAHLIFWPWQKKVRIQVWGTSRHRNLNEVITLPLRKDSISRKIHKLWYSPRMDYYSARRRNRTSVGHGNRGESWTWGWAKAQWD